jgi:hypothetical protein
MSNYTKTTDFAAKDSLPTGDAGKIIRGAEFGTEFDNIATAIATKADTAGPTLTGTTTFDTLSDGTIAVTAFVDEDDMSSDSATMLPTQQSVKAYVDSQTTAQDLDFEADTGGPLSIDLDSETLTFTGGTGIDTSGVDNAVTFAIDNTVTTLTDTQTLTNKTLTSPTLTGTTLTGTTLLADLIVNNRQVATDDASGVNIDGNDVTVRGGASTGTGAGGSLVFQTTPADVAGSLVNTFSTVMTLDESGIDVAGEVEFDSLSGTGAVSVTDILDEDDMTSDSDTSLATQQSIKAYVDSQVAGADSLAEILANGNATGGTDIAFGDNDKATFGAGDNLAIYSTGTQNYIEDAGTGNLNFKSNGNNFNFLDGSDNVVMQIDIDSETTLYHNTSAKLATTSTGINVTGDATFDDNGKAIFGAGSDLQIYHDGSNSRIQDAGSGNLKLVTDGAAIQLQSATENMIVATPDADVQLFYNGLQKLATTATGIDITGTATIDGLTVEGSGAGLVNLYRASANANFSAITFSNTTNDAVNAKIGWNTNELRLDGTSSVRLVTDAKNRILVSANGDISFYEDTGTTAKLFWDASAESLGINNSSPQASIHTTGDAIIGTATSGASYEGVLQIADGAVNGRTAVLIYNNHPDQFMKLGQDVNTAFIGRDQADEFAIGVFDNAADTTLSKQFVIDASGNVGIGTDSPQALTHIYTESAINTADTLLKLTNVANTARYVGFQAQRDNASGQGLNVLITKTDASVVNALTIDTSANVGIGTSPATHLHVQGSSGEIRVQDTGSGGGIVSFRDSGTSSIPSIQSSGNNLFVNTGGTDRMRIDSSGNVLVGTTNANPAANNVTGHALKAGGLVEHANSGAMVMRLNRTDSNGSIIEFRKGTDVVGEVGTLNSALTIGTGDTGIQFNADNNAVMPHNITTGANVDASIDIGYSSGGTNRRFKDLYLSGGVRGTSTIDITIPETSGGAINLEFGNNTNTTRRTVQAYKDNFEPAAVDTGVISLGQAGNKWKDLYLSGVAYSDSVLVGATTFASAGGGHLLAPSGTRSSSRTVTTAAFHNLFYNANGIVGGISTSGSATTFATSSDQRLKDNIVNAPSASDDIDAIQVRSFDWKVDGSHQKYGMVAQELQSVAPEAVSEGETEDDMMGVDYSKLVPMLVKEIQSLRARVAQLETN